MRNWTMKAHSYSGLFAFASLMTHGIAGVAAESPFSFRKLNSVSLELSESGKPVYVYNYGMILKDGLPETMRRSTYVHPIFTPGGVLITNDFSSQHAYHRGISWMWPVVVVDGKTYDMWAVGEWTAGEMRQKFIRWTARETGPNSALLAIENGWYIDDRKVVNERVEIRTARANGAQRHLDFRLEFEATSEPVEIAGSPERVKGSPERKKGFGGLCFRLAPRDGGAEQTVIRSERGVEMNDDNLAVHRWAQVEGMFQGRRAGGRIDDDSTNPGYPSGWLTRHGFGLLNPSYPGSIPALLVHGRPLVLKYRVTLWDGEAPRPTAEK